MERTVVEEAGERVGLRLLLEAGPNVRVVERERRGVAETRGELELLLGEARVLALAVDVEGALEVSSRDQRHDDQRLRLGRRAGDDSHPRVEMRLVREHGLAVLDGPACDSFAEREPLREHLRRPSRPDQARDHLPFDHVDLVDVHVVVRDQCGERVGDAIEQPFQALLREHLVEDVGKPLIRLDDALGGRVGSWRRRLSSPFERRHQPNCRCRRLSRARMHGYAHASSADPPSCLISRPVSRDGRRSRGAWRTAPCARSHPHRGR